MALRQKAKGRGQELSVLHLFENRYIVGSSIATSLIVGAIAALTIGLPQAQADTQQILSQRNRKSVKG